MEDVVGGTVEDVVVGEVDDEWGSVTVEVSGGAKVVDDDAVDDVDGIEDAVGSEYLAESSAPGFETR